MGYAIQILSAGKYWKTWFTGFVWHIWLMPVNCFFCKFVTIAASAAISAGVARATGVTIAENTAIATSVTIAANTPIASNVIIATRPLLLVSTYLSLLDAKALSLEICCTRLDDSGAGRSLHDAGPGHTDPA